MIRTWFRPLLLRVCVCVCVCVCVFLSSFEVAAQSQSQSSQEITFAASFASGPYVTPPVPNACCVEGELGARLAISELGSINNPFFSPHNVTLKMDLFYDQADPTKGVQVLYNRIQNQTQQGSRYVAAMFGQTSTVSQAQSYVAQAVAVPQIAWGSVSSALTPTSTFPGFVRTAAPLSNIIGMWIALCKRYNWKRIATISEAQPIWGDIMVAFQAAAVAAGIQVVAAETFASTASPRVNVMNIKNSGATIIFFMAYATQYHRVMLEAYRAGMMGVAGYQWFSHQSNAGDSFWVGKNDAQLPEAGAPGPSELAAIDVELFTASQYMISGQMSLGQPYFPPYQQYVTRFKQVYPTSIAGWSSIAYDTVYYIAHAIRNCLNANTSLDYRNVLKQFRTMSVEGVTGTVTLQQGNNDRRGLAFNIYNYVPKDVSCPNYQSNTSCWTWKLVGSYDDISSTIMDTNSTQVTFMGGRVTAPLDHIPLISTDRNQIHTVFDVLTIISLCSFVIIFVLYGYLREERIIKASSPLFDCLSILGCILTLVYNLLESDNPTNTTCMAQPWVLALGITTFMACLFAKTYRISRVFARARKLAVSTRTSIWELLFFVAALLVFDIIILAAWTGVDPLRATYFTGSGEYWTACASNDSNHVLLFSLLLVVYKIILLAAASLISINVNGIISGLRQAQNKSSPATISHEAPTSHVSQIPAAGPGAGAGPSRRRSRHGSTGSTGSTPRNGLSYDMFNDHKQIASCLYNLLFIISLALILGLTQQQHALSWTILRPILVLLATVPSVGILFVPKLYSAIHSRMTMTTPTTQTHAHELEKPNLSIIGDSIIPANKRNSGEMKPSPINRRLSASVSASVPVDDVLLSSSSPQRSSIMIIGTEAHVTPLKLEAHTETGECDPEAITPQV